jgi:hypothetical protein
MRAERRGRRATTPSSVAVAVAVAPRRPPALTLSMAILSAGILLWLIPGLCGGSAGESPEARPYGTEVELRGIEPLTSSLPARRSAS